MAFGGEEALRNGGCFAHSHEPALAEALGSLGFGTDEAGIWLIKPGDNGSVSPFELIAEGRTNVVLDSVCRMRHGFSA